MFYKRLISGLALLGLGICSFLPAYAGSVGCFHGRFGGVVDCGGGYLVTIPGEAPVTVSTPPVPARPPAAAPAIPATTVPATTKPPLVLTVVQGANGPCIANTAQDLAVLAAYTLVHMAVCPSASQPANRPVQVVNPTTIAVNFWRTIPLPVPVPKVPPGYALAGKMAYLVTGGTVDPAPFEDNTPLGLLTVKATGSYLVNWGDSSASSWSGPYDFEGLAYPVGRITHVYENSGTYTIGLRENWSATWSLAGYSGAVNGLATSATIKNLVVKQLQTILAN